MNILIFLLALGCLSVGFVGGMAFVTIVNAQNMKELREQNRQLRSDLNLIKRQKAHTIEIIDNRAELESYFAPF